MRKLRLCLLIIVTMCGSFTFAQSKQEVLDYMHENGVNMFDALWNLSRAVFPSSTLLAEFGYPGDEIELMLEAPLTFVNCVDLSPTIVLDGSAEALLSKQHIEDLYALRVANDFSMLPSCLEGPASQGALRSVINIWSVGDDYPMAYLLTYQAQVWSTPLSTAEDTYRVRYLGYASANQLHDIATTQLRSYVEDLAIRTLRLRRY